MPTKKKKLNKKVAKDQIKEVNYAKAILDKWATAVIRTPAIHEKNGVSIPNLKKAEDYTPKKYGNDIILWIPPKNCIRLEFEHPDYDTNLRCIRECVMGLTAIGFDHCVTEHKGGKSPYVNVFNIKGLPVNEDNPLAKNLLIDLIASNVIKEGLDRSNLGYTYSPVIGHPHWKKKYNGAIHKIIRGKDPLDHKNEYPKELLKQIKKSKTTHKYDIIQVQQNYPWVQDFLLNYCTENKLPVGNRNHVIEKNLAVLIIHHRDRDKIIQKYLQMQERKHNSLKGWFNKVIKKDIEQVNPLELKKYIKENNIEYTISEGNGKRGQRGQRWQRKESNKRNIIHGAGGIYNNTIIEPLGNYDYLYNCNGDKGIATVSFDPETKISTIEIEGETYNFSSEPLKKCLFKIPSEKSIQKYINNEYPVKTTQELYENLVNYLKILYDLPGEFYYHIITIGCLQSWVIDILYVLFYLCFSAKYGAGKTAFLEGISIISHHGFLAGNISSSSVARITNKYKLSLFADELDVKSNSKDNETYLTFRQGYKRNNPYVRQKETRNGYTEEIIDVFGYKGYSVHSRAEDALSTRGIEIPLRVSKDKTLPILNMYKDQIGFSLFEDMFFWRIENAKMLNNNTMETGETEKDARATDFLPLFPSLPSLPMFLPQDDKIKKISEIRETLFKNFTREFTEEEIETLKKFMGRNEELLYVALLVCKIFKINKLGELEHTFKQKVQNEGDDNIFVNLLTEYIKEIYQQNCNDGDFLLSAGDFEGCFYYEKSKVYRGFRKKLKDEDFFPINSDKFEEYLMDLNFNKGVNVKKEKIKLSKDKTTTRLCLIFDDEVMSSLELEKPKALDDYDKLDDKDESSKSSTTEENGIDDTTLLCEIRDVMKTRTRYEWKINEIAFEVGLVGPAAGEQIKKILEKELMSNPERTWIIKHDGSGLYWGYKELK